jgi:signal transduction histidine kinase
MEQVSAKVDRQEAPEDAHKRAPILEALPSVEMLRERILRRIMRVACGFGVLGILAGLVAVRPLDVPALIVGVVANLGIFLLTLAPERRRVISWVYPWTLVVVGVSFAWVGGPDTDPFVVIAGGLFIASLVLTRRELGALVAFLCLSALGVIFLSGKVWTPALRSTWIAAVTTMLAVTAPAAIAGRMLVSMLARALAQRESLVNRLLDESRELEDALRALEATRTQLTHAQKMELIGQMAGGIAHDMNNALTTVMGEASMLDDRAREERERIVDAATYAAKLTQQLMIFGRRDVSQPRPIDLTASIRASVRAIRRIVPSEIELLAHLPDGPIAVVADPTQVLQVLLNLAGNAKDAMNGSGKVELSLRADSESQRAIIEVSDNGAGIPAEVLPRIFEPFFTTKPAGQGTGLGLANVRQIVESMQGSIDVRSESGRGTTFTLRLPITRESVEAEHPTLAAPSNRGGTVLVVDDDVRVRAVVFTALERLGYRVLEAATPDAAVALARAEQGRIDLLLTDVVMPGGGGAATIARVRELYPNLRVLVMSGYNDDETLRRGISQGTFPFLAKPFSIDMLARAVESALAT